MIDNLMQKIKSNLTPDLLRPEYRRLNLNNPMFGHCYIASEALFYLSGGKASGLAIKRGRDDSNTSHWWLENKETGEILDPTVEQYDMFDLDPPYQVGVRTGFLTRTPSKRAITLMQRVLT